MTPLAFSPSEERPAPSEHAATADILVSMRGILETTWHDYGHSVRSVHAKSHGLLEGELRVLDGLDPALAQGLFARPGTYPVVLRFSTNPGDILDDTISSPRGLALKVIGVEGARLAGSEQDRTQDFVMVNGPAFVAPDAAAFARSLKLLAATTDTGQAWKKLLSAALRTTVKLGQACGLAMGGLKSLGGEPMTHPLGETFYTQTPFRHGAHVAKLSVAPTGPGLRALKDKPVRLAGRPNGLREALVEHFRAHGGEWELRVQLRTNAATMPIEDATVPWPEQESPYVAVARITVTPQPAWSEGRAAQVDDGMAFSPWHGLEAHRPLGSINRARKDAYPLSAGFRAARNGCPMHEPGAPIALSREAAAAYGRSPGREGRRPNTPDGRPGAWTQPMVAPVRKLTAGAIGGLAAGALVSGALLALAAANAEPDELVQLKRRSVRAAGRADRRDRAPAGVGERALAHGGHLALSAAAGAAYALAKPAKLPAPVAGAAMGAGFYALAYGVTGPALGLTPPLWRDSPASLARHGALHLVFGVVTALVTQQVEQQLERS